jgi:hypothetical protein
MASAEPKTASRRLLDAAAAERLTIEDDLRALDERRHRLHADLRSLEVTERALRRRLVLVSELAGAHQPRALRAVSQPPAREREVLRGAAIRRVAVEVVARCEDRLRPRHYTHWYDELLEAGYAVSGRDPVAAFLTQLSRSPVVVRESEPGTYRLNYEVVPELERKLLSLNDELARLQHGQQTIDAINSVRDERERLLREITQIERLLIEAVAVLHPQ